MSSIMDVIKTPKGTIICCALTDADFTRANTIRIVNDDANFILRKFQIAETRPCFTTTPPPCIKPEEPVPEKFLQRGNEVIFNIGETAFA